MCGHGQAPATHMLIVGPGGTGKTMTGSAFGELRLPLFSVWLEALFSRFVGETADKMCLLIDRIARTRSIYTCVLRARLPSGGASQAPDFRPTLDHSLLFFCRTRVSEGISP